MACFIVVDFEPLCKVIDFHMLILAIKILSVVLADIVRYLWLIVMLFHYDLQYIELFLPHIINLSLVLDEMVEHDHNSREPNVHEKVYLKP